MEHPDAGSTLPHVARKRRQTVRDMRATLQPALEVLWASETMRRARDTHGWPSRLPELQIRARSKSGTTGCVWVYRHEIHLRVDTGAGLAGPLEVLAHEVAHFHRDPKTDSGRRRSHGPIFRAGLCDLVCEVYDLPREYVCAANLRIRRTYALDGFLRAIIAERIPDILGRVGILPPRRSRRSR